MVCSYQQHALQLSFSLNKFSLSITRKLSTTHCSPLVLITHVPLSPTYSCAPESHLLIVPLSPTYPIFLESYLPIVFCIRCNWCMSDSPCQMGTLVRSSANRHPVAQTSTPGPYCVSPTRSSGARYHRVATYSV